ncbi:Imm17 family immunity protein [Streptococcus sp. SPS1]|uniref:Imm17 family immunity protein n=1 Tax=Streptococcus sp. SPS1 TaxID=3018247 RepID=UPI00263CE6AC|nr:Imm17 family immunity protein [Streptococcus sp. SPS1]MDN5027370.1 Imm17 family immunity protein [Streptococcus sp. SPS1]
MDEIFEWLKAYYQYVWIAGGLLFLIGAIRDWKWVYQAIVGDKARHAFIFEVWGEKGL